MSVTFKISNTKSHEQQTIHMQCSETCKNNMHPKSFCNKRICFGRSFEYYLASMCENTSLSRNHLMIDYSRAYSKYYIPHRFFIFLVLLLKSGLYFPENILKNIFRFYVIPRKVTLYPNKVLEKYIRVKDLGSMTGISLRVNDCKLESGMKFSVSDRYLTIESVKEFSNASYDKHFFRGINPSYLLKIDPAYIGTVYNDRDCGLDGDCGYPYLQFNYDNDIYVLVATLHKSTFTCGRNDDCDIFINCGTISRVQFRIIYNLEYKC